MSATRNPLQTGPAGLRVCVALLAPAFVACGSDVMRPVSHPDESVPIIIGDRGTIGNAGGKLVAALRGRTVELIVPADAVTEPRELKAEDSVELPPGAIGLPIVFGPAGLKFERDVTMAFRYGPGEFPAVLDRPLRLATLVDGEWQKRTSCTQCGLTRERWVQRDAAAAKVDHCAKGAGAVEAKGATRDETDLVVETLDDAVGQA